MPEYLFEFAALVTKEGLSENEIDKYMLSLRYYHKNDLSRILQFAVLILSCNHLNYQKELNYSIIAQLFKQLLLEADFFFLLLTYSKLLPLLAWAHSRTQREIDDALGPAFRELTRPLGSKESKVVSGGQGGRCMGEHLGLLRLLDSKNLFLFFFNLINGTNEGLQNDIDIYFLELASSDIHEEGLISSSQLIILQKNMQLEYGKLRKRKYQEEIIETVYKWLEIELEPMFYQGESPSHLSMEIFSQIARSQSNIAGTTLLQVLDASVESIQPAKMNHFLQLVDACLIEGTYKISAQTILFLVCTIFTKIHSRKLSVRGQAMIDHFLLWKEVAIRKDLPVKLLICLIEWLPFLYTKPIPRSQQEPEILQLYRQEILKLANEATSSQISGLRVLIEQLEYRKMEGIYAQLEEFHSQMEQPERHSALSKPSNNHQIDFHFKISGLSKSNSQINSLLNSLESISQNRAKSRNMQLQILSKPQTQGSFGSFASSNSQRSIRECVEIIMSLIDLFDYHVKEPSSYYSSSVRTSSLSSSKTPSLLPVLSTHRQLSEKEERGKEGEIELRVNVGGYSEQAKKRMLKRRGLIAKQEWVEIGYQLENKEGRVGLYVTLLRPVTSCELRIRQNSFKVQGEKEWRFNEPAVNKQYQVSYEVSSVKLYSLEGVAQSERVVRSRLQVKRLLNRKVEEEVYEIPLTIFSFVEWLPITAQQLPHLPSQPIMQTKWVPVCAKFMKYGGQYLGKFLCFAVGEKGSYWVRWRALGTEGVGRVVVVAGQAKMVVLDGRGELGAMGLLEVIA